MDRVGLIQVVKRSPFGAGIFDGREVDEVSLEVLGVYNKIYHECIM